MEPKQPKAEKVNIELEKLKLERANVMTELRSQMLNEGTKGLFIMNGGGAIALATWLQAIWDKPWASPMLCWQLWGMAAFAAGIGVAVAVPLARYLGSLHKNTHTPRKNPWWWAYIVATIFSILSFAVGSGLVVRGGFAALPTVTASSTLPTS